MTDGTIAGSGMIGSLSGGVAGISRGSAFTSADVLGLDGDFRNRFRHTVL